MAQINVKPLKMADVLLKIKSGATDVGDFEKAVSAVEFQPQTGSVEWKGLDPAAVFQFPTATSWKLMLAFAQDWAATTSLSRYLFDNDGKEVTMFFQPNKGTAISATNPAVKATVILSAGAIGGQVDSVAVGSVTLAIQGKPEFVSTLA